MDSLSAFQAALTEGRKLACQEWVALLATPPLPTGVTSMTVIFHYDDGGTATMDLAQKAD